MKQLKGIEAVFFDLDGTLIDSLDDLGSACNHVLAAHGLPEHPLGAYAKMVGNGFETLVRRAVPKNITAAPNKALLEDLVTEARNYYATHLCVHTRPYPGICDMLASLAKAGLCLGVYTNKPDEPCRELIGHFFGNIAFRVIQGAKANLPLKPDPAVLNQIIAELGIAKRNFAYVGDSDVDMLTAKNCAIAGIGAAWGFRGADELAAAGATLIAQNAEEIKAILTP